MPQTPCAIRLQRIDSTVTPLPMGGTNPQGIEITANQHYLTLNGKPWMPIMGEFHFSRYPEESWETELLKMKAGGITVVATYLFWIHLEEIEGQFDWSGRRNLRRFVELCGKHGLYAYPRIGPWAHGECRNGGFPDWLLEKCGEQVRQNAPRYLSYVLQFYREISRQLHGLLWKDGGPIIGIQIENELLNNAPHIHTLKDMACQVGLDVPIYTMTGWGPADVPEGREIIPVFGGYADAFWDRQTETWSRGSRKHYFFSNLRDDNTIGADLNKRSDVGNLDYLAQFPFGTCETGGGMQTAYHRRPLISADDTADLALVKVGNGSNLQGYYMYHGGANPEGKRSMMQESQVTGYWNDLPMINYDFQAPLGQYGQVRAAYHALRPLHLFIQDFGAQLAPMPMTLPDTVPANLDDQETLRWAVRSDGKQGFIFINNYQRVEALSEKAGVQFHLELAEETLVLPRRSMKIPAGMYTIWPFNLDLHGPRLKYATAQLVCVVDCQGGPCFVFFTPDGMESEFAFESASLTQIDSLGSKETQAHLTLLTGLKPGMDCLTTLTGNAGQKVHILLLNQIQARQLYKANLWGQNRLVLSSTALYFENDTLHFESSQPGGVEFWVFPPPPDLVTGSGLTLSSQPEGIFAHYHADLPVSEIAVEAQLVQAATQARAVPIGGAGVAQAPDDADFDAAAIWQITLPENALDGAEELLLAIEYTGDAARLYLGNQLVDDDFYHGQPWEVGLRRFGSCVLQDELTLRILPLRKDAPIYLPPECQPDFASQNEIVQVRGISAKQRRALQVKLAS